MFPSGRIQFHDINFPFINTTISRKRHQRIQGCSLLSLSWLACSEGVSRPPPHQAVAGAAPGHSSAPALSRPLHSPFRARARASPALSSAPGPAPPLLILARCFLSRPQVLSFPARWVPRVPFTDLFGRQPALQSPGSRRSVAPFRLGAPPAAPFSPALPRGCHRPSWPGCAALRAASPAACIHSPSAPKGLPLCLRIAPDDRFAATGAILRHFVLLLLPGPGRPHYVRTAGPRALRPAPRPHKPADAPFGRHLVVLRAVGRQTLRADCLGPPVS